MRAGILLIAGLAGLAAACAPDPAEDGAVHVTGACEAPTPWAELPAEVRETSGVAASSAHTGVFWTHNDSEGDSAVFALDSTGTVLGRVRVRGATNRDWEDIAVAACSPASDGDCLFIGDIGDNRERREGVVIFIVAEPDPLRDSVSVPAVRLEAAYPDGGRDAEGLYVNERGIHLVTKGRTRSVELYRLRPPFTPGNEPSTLERVQELAPPPTSVSAQVTAAAASPDGRTVVIRTYSGLRFFDAAADTLRPLAQADFSGPAQPLGEGVDFMADQRLVLTGEAGGRVPATIAAVRCDPRAAPPDSGVSGG